MLPGLIDGWLNAPEFSARALEMLTLLFQQRTDGDDLGLYLRFRNNQVLARTEAKSGIAFSQYIEKSFALTAWEIIQAGRPYTDVLTTRTYMLNVPLMSLLARIDARPADDMNRRQRGWIEVAYPNLSLTAGRRQRRRGFRSSAGQPSRVCESLGAKDLRPGQCPRLQRGRSGAFAHSRRICREQLQRF